MDSVSRQEHRPSTRSSETRAVDPVWTRIREAAQQAAAAEPVLAGTLHATILSQPRFESALSYHLARLVGTTEVPGRPDPPDLRRGAERRPGDRLRRARRHRRRRRPRPRLHLASRPAAVVQGLPGAADLPRGALAVGAGRRDLAHYLQSRASAAVRPRHPSRRGDRQGHLHRPRHRRGDRRDRRRRGRRLDAARRDAGRHRQGTRRPPSQGAPRRAARRRREGPRQHRDRRLRQDRRRHASCSKPSRPAAPPPGVPARIIGCVDVPEPALEMDQRI